MNIIYFYKNGASESSLNYWPNQIIYLNTNEYSNLLVLKPEQSDKFKAMKYSENYTIDLSWF